MLKYYRTIAFSYSVLKTSFIFENKFQILPLNMEGKPQNPVARHFPFFLEYTIEFQENEPEDEIELMAIRKNKEKEILNLLLIIGFLAMIRPKMHGVLKNIPNRSMK